MSASRERKMRVEQNSLAQPEKKKTKKLSEGWIFAITMILVLAVAIGGIMLYNHCRDHATVLTVGDYEVEAYEFNYFYRELAASCDQYASYLGIDTTVALTEQKVDSSDLSLTGLLGLDTTCLDSLSPVDGVYDYTWAQLISYNAMKNAASAYAVYQEAEKVGYQLDAESVESIDSSIAEIKTYADENGVSVDEYIEAVFGRGCDEESYRHYMKVVSTASAYPSTIEYTVAEKAERDAQNPADFDNVAFYYYINNASTIKTAEEAAAEEEAAENATDEATDEATDVVAESTEEVTEENTEDVSEEQETSEETSGDEAEEPSEDETTEEAAETEEEAAARRDAEAKAAAEKMAAQFDSDADDVSIYADYTRKNLEDSAGAIVLPEEALDWLFGEAVEGEVKMFTVEADAETEGDENDYVVVKFINRDNYFTANYLSITIADDAETTEEETAEGEETTEETEKSAAEKIAEIKASLEADPSEENFREWILANLDHEHEEGEEHDHSAEGLTEDATRYSIANTSKELFNWLMLEERKAGDWTVIEMDGQTVFYFYLEQGQDYRDMCIENTLLNEWYEELTTNAIANCGYDADAVPENTNIKFY